jgi:hypothetical protein
MVASRRWDLETLIDIGLPPVPEDAPVRFKGRYSGLVQALARGHCPECLVDLVVVPEPSRPWNVTMEHIDGCPYSAPSMRSLVDELGLTSQIDPGPPAVAVDRELFEAIEDLEFDPYL